MCSMWRFIVESHSRRDLLSLGVIVIGQYRLLMAEMEARRRCHCLLLVSCGRRHLETDCSDILMRTGGWCTTDVRRLCRRGTKQPSTNCHSWLGVCVCRDINRWGAVTLGENTCCSRNPTCFDFGVGVRACVMGGGFGAVRILFVMVQRPPVPPPSLSLSTRLPLSVSAHWGLCKSLT